MLEKQNEFLITLLYMPLAIRLSDGVQIRLDRRLIYCQYGPNEPFVFYHFTSALTLKRVAQNGTTPNPF